MYKYIISYNDQYYHFCFITAITSGEMPPSYFVYTTGNGFPPIIESVPHALKGIGTAFMLAILTGKLCKLSD